MKKLLLSTLILLLTGTLFAQSNQYLHFDRQDDYVRLDGGSQFITNQSAFSMAGWFYTDQLAYGQGMMGFRGSGNGFYVIQLANGKLECRLQTSTGLHEYVGPDFTILPGQWQHVAWVYSGSSVSLYIDGSLHGSSPASGMISDANIPFTIGRSILTNLNFYFGGRADEVSVWTKALSATDIQDMMTNELTGTEADLQLYYKMNQGAPGGDNTAITQLISEVGAGARDADLIGFGMNGSNSNFAGTLQTGFQAISFDGIPNKLVTDAPFVVSATASSGLPVSYSIVSGPATLTDSTITLNGTAGEVVVTASQPGDTLYDPAGDVTQSFFVVDPNQTLPQIDLRNPLAGDVIMLTPKTMQLAAIATTEFPELLEISSLQFEINGDVIPAKHWGEGHYTAWWTPPGFGVLPLVVRAFNNFGASSTQIVNIDIKNTPSILDETAFSGVWINSTVFTQEVTAELPAFVGSYNQINATLNVTCPPGGCGPWDRVAKVEVKTHEGRWVEMIRYITPYGVACSHNLDVTDFMSALQGKITFRVSCETFDNGFEYQLNLTYTPGISTYSYSMITPVWHQTYDFGNPSKLDPVETKTVRFPENTEAAKFKLIGTGHGWGDNNTGNAAEFYDATHHIWVDGVQTFAQHNWLTCNPNPDGCSPQNGTWFHNRAGFCPGAISPWFDYDMGPYIANETADLDYVFDQTYVDLCHANNPNCVSGVTCPNCNDGFNPHLIVASSLINFSSTPLDTAMATPIEEELRPDFDFVLFPNPSRGPVEISLTKSIPRANILVLNALGERVEAFENVVMLDKNHSLDLQHLAQGVYMIVLATEKGRLTKMLQIE
jgi:hypothetical protein